VNKLFTHPPEALRSCLPDARQRLLLELCFAPEPARARAAWEAWVAQVDIERLETASSRLLPLAYHRLAAWRIQHPELPRLAGVLRHAWADNLSRRHKLAPVLAELDRAGIPHLLLKGAPLAFAIYPNPGARPMDDVDVLVPLARGREALALLTSGGGWVLENPLPPPPADPAAPDPMLFKHGCALKTASGLHLDLHWFALADCCQPGADDGFWARRRPLPGAGTAWQPAPEDNFLHLCVHGLRANPVSSIRWIADTVLLLRAAENTFDWALLLAEARRRRLVAPLRHAVDYLHAEFAAPVPPAWLEKIRSEPLTRLERAAHRGNIRSDFAGQFAATWLRYRRTSARLGALRAAAGFPTYLRHAWGHVSFRRVFAHIIRRSLRRGQKP
jgi:Uncharacterised nucleotidyltransferase